MATVFQMYWFNMPITRLTRPGKQFKMIHGEC